MLADYCVTLILGVCCALKGGLGQKRVVQGCLAALGMAEKGVVISRNAGSPLLFSSRLPT